MKAYERFLNYVMFDTTSSEDAGTVPSTPGQMTFAKALTGELKGLGIEDVRLDEKGYLYGSIPSNLGDGEDVPVIGFLAHLDTSDAHPSPSKPPQIIKDYDGSVISLESGVILNPADDENLRNGIGCDLIVTDGYSLLGGDDKAGVAEIVSAMEYLLGHPEIKHGKIAFSFTPDEEIGTGQDNFDVKAFGADFAYTLDGADFGGVDFENFNASTAEIKIQGVLTHPGTAKDKMKNASLIGMEFNSMLPPWQRPEHTENYEGFFHLSSVQGDCESCAMRYLIRELDREKFEEMKVLILKIAELLNMKYGNGTVNVEITDSYRNMAEKVRPHIHLIDFAVEAVKECGGEPLITPIRGGTDGAELSFKGVPCPNLGNGSFNHHSLNEVANIQSMEKCTEMIVKIAEKYGKYGKYGK